MPRQCQILHCFAPFLHLPIHAFSSIVRIFITVCMFLIIYSLQLSVKYGFSIGR
ncbi:hypothetical protein CLOSTASPAR_01188 [[Clostridium] asparagiforme DSM 15981]|uniref:Uncharacterized protein n=1 Tax=[Clostridium] asparagiforme DSM 15981 TaxID=518636 RepID=C0CW35_9FIRM|nr:hypothetical protein CLOSTASPAR_01188 [[Clostridium] asparagiforme DSM 15981]